MQEQHAVIERDEVKKKSNAFLFHYLLAIFLCGLDYKASASGDGFFVQAPIWGFFFLSFFILSIQLIQAKSRIREMYGFLLICVSFLVFSSIVGFWWEQDPWTIFTNGISFSVYVTAAVSTLIVLKLCPDRTAMLSSMKTVCLAFMIFHFLMVYITGGGINFATSRYSYLSGATVPASAILSISAVLYFGKKELLIALTNVAIILISVTRTQLVVIAGQIASLFFAFPALILRPAVVIKGVFVTLIVFTVIAVDLGSGINLTERWISRIFAHNAYGIDPTALTRIAESNYMYDRFTSSFETLMIGNGLAAETELTGASASLAAKIVGSGSVTSVHSAGFGHNNHMSVIFVGGLLLGGPLLLLNFINGFQSLVIIRELFKHHGSDGALPYFGIWGALIVLGMLAEGFLSGTFSDRASCLWYGIGTGMLYWARQETRQKRAPLSSNISVLGQTGMQQ
jgi:hypothetical protein